jgi:hypothetical protein
MLTMFFNYSLKLDARTVKLEKKNGKELAEIEKVKKEQAELKTYVLSALPKEKNPS